MTQTVLIADDHPLFRQAMAMAVARVLPDARVVEAGTLGAAARAASEHDALALILLDLKMPGAVGYSAIALLHAEHPAVPIIVVSSAEGTAAADEARAFGATGFLSKGSDLATIETTIAAAVRRGGASPVSPHMPQSPAPPSVPPGVAADTVREPDAGLTPTQLKVLLAVLDGQLNKQIAHSLGMTEATVKAHMTAIMRKLDVRNRTQAALVARSLGLDLRH